MVRYLVLYVFINGAFFCPVCLHTQSYIYIYIGRCLYACTHDRLVLPHMYFVALWGTCPHENALLASSHTHAYRSSSGRMTYWQNTAYLHAAHKHKMSICWTIYVFSLMYSHWHTCMNRCMWMWPSLEYTYIHYVSHTYTRGPADSCAGLMIKSRIWPSSEYTYIRHVSHTCTGTRVGLLIIRYGKNKNTYIQYVSYIYIEYIYKQQQGSLAGLVTNGLDMAKLRLHIHTIRITYIYRSSSRAAGRATD
jgi:hypothetical protein